MNYDLCSGTCLKKSGIYSVAMFQGLHPGQIANFTCVRFAIFYALVFPAKPRFSPSRRKPGLCTRYSCTADRPGHFCPAWSCSSVIRGQ